MSAPGPIAVEVVREGGRLAELRAEWNELLEDSLSDCVFLTWEWLSTWWKHLSRGRRLFVVVVRERGRAIALAPLVVRPPGLFSALPFTTFEFMGTGSVGSDRLDVILRRGREAEGAAVLAGHLARARRALELGQVRVGASGAAMLGARLRQEGWGVRAEPTDISRYIDLSGLEWPSYLAGLGAAHRADFRRKLRRAGSDCRLAFRTVATEDRRLQALHRLIALHNARWRERGASNAFHTPHHVRFHEEMTRLASERGWLRIHTLWLDGAPAASLYGFRYGSVFSFYQSGFDPAYASYSAGLVTMGLSIRSAIEEGAREYDLLQGDETYKSRWARVARTLGRIELYPPRLRGRIYQGTMELSRAARRTARGFLPKRIVDRLTTGVGRAAWEG
jgi:CelD/BcsL family acetyltransferase involved in cellulose biosynthesis